MPGVKLTFSANPQNVVPLALRYRQNPKSGLVLSTTSVNVSPEASSRKQTEPGVPTVTRNAHVAVLPAASDAVHVTVVELTAKNVPEAGTHTTVAPEQLSVTGGVT